MRSKTLIFVFLGSAVVGLSVYAKTPVKSDAAFLSTAAQADMTIAHMSQDTESKAANDKVRDFAKTLVQEHTTDYQELTELAEKTGDKIPRGIDRENFQSVSALEHAKGKAFERAFLTRQSAEHQKLVRAYKQEADHGSNPAIRAYASKALPVVEQHLREVEDLLKMHS
jgi:putative membrane protein